MRLDEYTKKIDRLRKSIEKMLMEDFPKDREFIEQIDEEIFGIHFDIMKKFLKKGVSE